MSLVFDRAVEFYDQTRALPPEIMDPAMQSLVHELQVTSDSRVLEIGVGTGRFALPVAERIGRVFGIDLSVGMMEVLKRKKNAGAVRLAQADATALPFPTDTFNAVYAVHVLHLVSGWQNAVREVMRVLAPGGRFIINFHRRDTASPNVLIRRQLRDLALEFGLDLKRPGAQSEDEILEELQRWDPDARLIEVAEWTEDEAVGTILEEVDRQIFSETWAIPREVMEKLIPRLQEWAITTFGSIDAQISMPYSFRWLVVQKK